MASELGPAPDWAEDEIAPGSVWKYSATINQSYRRSNIEVIRQHGRDPDLVVVVKVGSVRRQTYAKSVILRDFTKITPPSDSGGA